MKTINLSLCTLTMIISMMALNAAAQDNRPLLEEIIVTAEKRSESLQDLSQAVTALSGEDIDRSEHYLLRGFEQHRSRGDRCQE